MDQVLGEKTLLSGRNCSRNYSYMNFKSLTGLINSKNPEILMFLSFSGMSAIFSVIFCISWVCLMLETQDYILP